MASSHHLCAIVAILVLLLNNRGKCIATQPQLGIKAEPTITEIQQAFTSNKLNSTQLLHLYLHRIKKLNPTLRAVIEVNPLALHQAHSADLQRIHKTTFSPLHGIPVLLKDNIATRDKLNTTAGSLALLGSVVPRDAFVVQMLRRAGAVILGKATLSEWSGFRSDACPPGWSARGGQGNNPYVLSATPCGSSSGPAIAVAANMAVAALGSETDGSIICPASVNSVVGIKPSVGLTSRSGVVPISPRQDTIGPFGRTVADAVHVLDVIVGADPRDNATIAAAKFIPVNGYKLFLKLDGLKGKRLGILRDPFFIFANGSLRTQVFEGHFKTLRRKGAILIDNLEIANLNLVRSEMSGETTALSAEFKLALNAYLSELIESPVRTLADVIAFNKRHSNEEMLSEYGQDTLTISQNTKGIKKREKRALLLMSLLSKYGIEKLMKKHKLDALVTPGSAITPVLAIGGYPGISVPAGYEKDGIPFGICFGGLRGSEPKLIEIAYAFEQATKIRRPPSFLP
ncbi:hypothetical protein Sjap_009984 [Stephania japonica]|uniref:Amidase domain-containing protein n=1 Tax=Stephania japonica TaxID=461633 RepID=A0AAP0JAT3_9MAGN